MCCIKGAGGGVGGEMGRWGDGEMGRWGGGVRGWGGIAITGKKLMGYFFGIQEIMHSYHANSSA